MYLYLILCSGIFLGFTQAFLNTRVVLKCFLSTSTWKKIDFKWIVARTVLDILLGLIAVSLFTAILLCELFPELFSAFVIFCVGLLATHVTSIRGFLAASIAIERTCAIVFPIYFKQYRKSLTNFRIFAIFLVAAFFDDFMLFYVFGFKLPLNPECRAYMCFVPFKYVSYATLSFTIITFIIYFFSFFLLIKMIIMYYQNIQLSNDMLKVNLLCLADLLCSVVFEFTPAVLSKFIGMQNNLGPLLGVLRTAGRVCEAISMLQLMRRNISPGIVRKAWGNSS